MEYLYILDYANARICMIEIEEDHEQFNIYDLLKEYGLNEDECSYMFSEKPLWIEKL